MKFITASILALGLYAVPAMAGDFSGAFGRDTSCQPSVGNWVDDARQTCPMLGNGSGITIEFAPGDDVTPPKPYCPPKEETPA